MIAFSRGLYSPIRFSTCRVSSSAEIFRARIATAAACAVPKSASKDAPWAATTAGTSEANPISSRRFSSISAPWAPTIAKAAAAHSAPLTRVFP